MRSISFSPLWKKLIDLNMSKSELAKEAKLSRSTLYQISQNESVTLDTVLRICNALDCEIYDVVEMPPASAGNRSEEGR